MVTVLAIGAGVAAAALVDDGSGSVARPSTPAATATNTADVETLWRWLAQLPAADRDQALAALVADPAGAARGHHRRLGCYSQHALTADSCSYPRGADGDLLGRLRSPTTRA